MRTNKPDNLKNDYRVNFLVEQVFFAYFLSKKVATRQGQEGCSILIKFAQTNILIVEPSSLPSFLRKVATRQGQEGYSILIKFAQTNILIV